MYIKQLVASIVSSDVLKNSAKLLTANVIVQLIGLLVYPILTRLYAPDDFGLFNLFLSIAGVLSLIATAEMQYAILLPKSDNQAVACVHIGGVFSIIICFCILCFVPFATTLCEYFKVPRLAEWFWGLPIYVLISSCWTLLNYWYTRQKKFNAISSYQIVQCVTNAGAKCGFGFTGFLRGGMIISAIISPIISLIQSILLNFKCNIPLIHFSKQECRTALREYANFPKFALPRALINMLSSNLIIFLLTPFFGLKEIGFLGMALLLAYKPINMISNSLYQVFYQRTSEHVQRKETIKGFFKRFWTLTLVLVIPCFTILYFILPQLTEFLLGSEWRETGEYIRLLLIWLTTTCIILPISFLQDIFQQQRTYLFFEILLFIVRIACLCTGIYCNDIFLSIATYSIGSAIVFVIQLLWYISLIRKYENTIENP